MSRRFMLMVALFLCLGSTFSALADDPSAISDTPGATLLLPYFEVDLGNSQGSNTIFSINNASATAILAHVTIWSDLSVPVLAYNIYLTGYDVQVIDLRGLFYSGTLSRTASDGQDPTDTISPQGPFSQDINFASCYGQLPLPNLDAAYLLHLRNSLTGQASSFLGDRCAGTARGDNIARGYITVDTVNNCTLRVAGDPGYFGPGGTGDVTNQNVLWGDYYYITAATNYSAGFPMVALKAWPGVGVGGGTSFPSQPQTSVPGEYTFYGRYVAWTASDNRQPLATNFATRFMLNTLYFPGGTELVVWRDPKVNQGSFTCPALAGVRPSWYPLGQEAVLIFDEQENPSIPPPPPVFPFPPDPVLAPFKASTQKVVVGSSELPVPYNRGWMFLNLNTAVAAAGANPPESPAAAQGLVTTIYKNVGRYSVGSRAVQLDSATNANMYNPGGF